jgi:hypothetical protein
MYFYDTFPTRRKTDEPNRNLHKFYSSNHEREPSIRRINFLCVDSFILMDSADLLYFMTSFVNIIMERQ